MRVLLIGEFSGVHTNLKAGLEKLGVEVDLANLGDGFKKFQTDLVLRVEGSGFLNKIENRCLETINLNLMKKYDVIQIMHPKDLSFYDKRKVFKLFDSGKAVVQIIGGCDYVNARFYENISDKMCHECKRYDLPQHICPWTDNVYIKYQREFYSHIDVFVPLCWEYYYTYNTYMSEYKNRLNKMIPMPIDISTNKYVDTKNDKIQVWHPLNRIGVKGTKEIEKAFEILRNKCGDVAEFHIKGKMPIDEYKKVLSKMDIVVDQLYDCTLGMNALYSMALGKVIITGNDDERVYIDYPELREMPVYRLGHTTEEIVENISNVIYSEDIIKRKKESRAYIEKYHDSVKVAREYIKLYERLLEKNTND